MQKLTNALGGALSWWFIAAAIISSYEVVMRYLFNAPSSWVHVAATALCAVPFCFGGAWCMLRGEHISITLIPDRLGERGQRAVEILSLLLGLFYLGGLGWGVWLQAADSALRFDEGRWLPELTPGPPNWPLPSLIKVSLFLAVLLFLAVTARQLLRLIRGAKG